MLQECSSWVATCCMRFLGSLKSLAWICFIRSVVGKTVLEVGLKRKGTLLCHNWRMGWVVLVMGFMQQAMEMFMFWGNVRVIWEVQIVGIV